MKNPAIQFIIMASAIFLCWFSLSRIDYIGFFELEKAKSVNEQKLGDLMLDTFAGSGEENKSDSIQKIFQDIKSRLSKANKFAADSIHIHLIEKDEVNAFALPGNHIVVYTGLIEFCENPEQLSGVLAHELAHLRKSHVMKKLIKEAGLSVLISVAGGRGGSILKKLTEKISSSAYDRSLESEADEEAVRYLTKAGIDPENFANLLFKFSDELPNLPTGVEWISSHPESKERAAKVLELKPKNFHKGKPLLSDGEWKTLQNAASPLQDEED